MPQNQILQKIRTAIYSDDLTTARDLIFNSTEEKANTETISDALKLAADNKQWDIVQQICQMESENKPSQAAIAYTLQKIVNYATNEEKEGKYLDLLQFICEKTQNKPSEKAINETLEYAYTYGSLRWDFVKYLCALKDSKPTQPFVDGALKNAVDRKQWDIVQQICQMESENKPSQAAIDYTLQKIVNYATDEVKEGKYLVLLQFICEKTPSKPSEKAINETLEYAYTYGSLRWDFVKYLCALKENKPKQPYINGALEKAARSGNLEIVQYICKLPSDRCPQTDSIGRAFISAAQGGNITIIRFFWEEHTIKPGQKDIAKAFVEAAYSGSLEIGKYFLNPENGFQVNSKDIDDALLKTVTARNGLEIIQYLLKNHLPTQEAIDLALNKAEAEKKPEIKDLLKRYSKKEIEKRSKDIGSGIDANPTNMKGLFTNKNAHEIDHFLNNNVPKNLNLKETKQAYIAALERIASNLQPEQKKRLALYILNTPNHFLKTERHFFRTQKYSNETLSVYQLIKTLMQGDQEKDKITIHDEEHNQNYVISRHVK